MARPPRSATVRELLGRHGRTFADELGIDLSRERPSDLFRWLCASILMGAPIRAPAALGGARALAERGWTTPEALTRTTPAQRTRTLNRAGYARWDARAAILLGRAAKAIVEDHDGDLRKVRAEAEGDPARLRRLLKRLPGVGDVVVDIFFREIQAAWDELAPFADRRVLLAARRFHLPGDPRGLATLVPHHDFPRLVSALVRADLAKVSLRELRPRREAT